MIYCEYCENKFGDELNPRDYPEEDGKQYCSEDCYESAKLQEILKPRSGESISDYQDRMERYKFIAYFTPKCISNMLEDM